MVNLTHVETISVIYSILGGFILLYGLCSLVIKERLYISEAMVAITIGVIFGPVCANFINVTGWGGDVAYITRELARLAIGIQVMAAGVSLPKAYLRREFRSMLIMLIPVMIVMWVMTGLCVWAMVPQINYLEALMIASCFTPTDPVLANSIVSGKFAEKRVPINVRHLILAESGANDGLGFPFLYLAIYLIKMPVGPAIGEWAYHVLVYEILLSIVIGFVVGYVARKLLKLAETKKWIDKESFLVYAIALALFLMGTVSLMGSDDLLACFIAGNSFTWDDWFRKSTIDAHMSEVVDLLLNLSVFVYIGATIPWSLFQDDYLQLTVWRLVVLAILVLLFRRLPIVIALYKFVPAIHTWREALFTGWFGPIGVGAIFYYTEAIDNFTADGPEARARSLVEPIVYFMVLSSVIVHGITIPLFHIGSFASRTLTRTSMSSVNTAHSKLSRLPQFVRRSMSQPTSINGTVSGEPADYFNKHLEDMDGVVASTADQPPRHKAITIVIPDIHHANSHHPEPDIGASSSPSGQIDEQVTVDDDQNDRTSFDSTEYLPNNDADDDRR
ncbi:hypothetical protein DM01DRAFT_1408872 [Hesseltinella vesiculosa]|uniref:Cation/H+ exchanger transmembrane domain-containing protein n=1 Tax=Hesseltinella vesiculosa TaxID=101127 RepID=A0A1X2GCS7_9FUNG|nr:hypothetical protein DM01DRAFT_1408872 [Hesseltinella vesiculosa]